MRPTVTEQLDGVRQTLDDVVRPHVTDEYARGQLEQVVAVLAHLADRWHRIGPLLAEDNTALGVLVAGLAGEFDANEPALAERLRAAAAASPDPLDLDALTAQNDVLRRLVVDAIEAFDRHGVPDGPVRSRLRAELIASTARMS